MHSLYHSPYILWVVQTRRGWAGHVSRTEEVKSAFKLLKDKLKRKKPLGRRTSKDNIITDLKEINVNYVLKSRINNNTNFPPS